jgi:hypothetical protein
VALNPLFLRVFLLLMHFGITIMLINHDEPYKEDKMALRQYVLEMHFKERNS